MSILELLVTREINTGMAVCLKPSIPFVMTPTLVHEIRILQNKIAEEYYNKPWDKVFYVVWHLYSGQITWRGLDFNFISETLGHHHDKVFESYIQEIFDVLYLNYVGLDIPLINCSIIERTLKGVSREFFLINRINFIKNTTVNIQKSATDESISASKVGEHYNNLAFPSEIYNRNQFYFFSQIDFRKMRLLISKEKYQAMAEGELLTLKLMFEEIKEQTIKTFYEMQAKNPKLLERLAKIQSAEYDKFVMRR